MPAQGYLQVHVYTSRANLPIEGAAVSVSGTQPDGKQHLIAFRTTDTSGNSGTVTLPTPDLSMSLDSAHPGGFSVVDISVDYPQYERVLVEDVQIFPGITTIQDVQLLPMDVLPKDWGEFQDFVVTPQEL